MSFSSGTFSLVAGNPVVTGTTISSTVQNNTMNDVATGLSTCILKDGTQTTTATIPIAGALTVGTTLGVTGTSTVAAVNASGLVTATTAGVTVPATALGTVYGSSYTPSITGGTNITGTPSGTLTTYARVGNTVMLAGSFDFTATSTGNTTMRISLPVASAFATGLEGNGTGRTGYGDTASLSAAAATDDISVVTIASSSGAQGFVFNFIYRVV